MSSELLEDLDRLDEFTPIESVIESIPVISNTELFSIDKFIEELKNKSSKKNKIMQANSNTISGYDIAHNCIRQTLFKIRNAPVHNFADAWLPLSFRAKLGTTVHDFIQETSQFTEVEASVKVPSINVSVRLDALISNNIVVEIKSCTYTDYKKIIKSRKPRDGDFYQVLFYKWLLENHLNECQQQTNTRTAPPKLNNYKIDNLQLIYVAHDIVSSDADSMSECVKMNQEVKKLLNSKYNPFHFITVLNINLKTLDVSPYENFIVSKLNETNKHLNNNSMPSRDNPFIDLKSCFFCLYKNLCSQYT